mmetsp:Transcript_23055/g.60227  ORF Transcript_23055/g.60227 Transcript_23055/m.60227 type:complete len:299 (+) Transcript_23055:290-1186(+)
MGVMAPVSSSRVALIRAPQYLTGTCVAIFSVGRHPSTQPIRSAGPPFKKIRPSGPRRHTPPSEISLAHFSRPRSTPKYHTTSSSNSFAVVTTVWYGRHFSKKTVSHCSLQVPGSLGALTSDEGSSSSLSSEGSPKAASSSASAAGLTVTVMPLGISMTCSPSLSAGSARSAGSSSCGSMIVVSASSDGVASSSCAVVLVDSLGISAPLTRNGASSWPSSTGVISPDFSSRVAFTLAPHHSIGTCVAIRSVRMQPGTHPARISGPPSMNIGPSGPRRHTPPSEISLAHLARPRFTPRYQ